MLTKGQFMEDFQGHANQYASYMVIDVNEDDVIRVLNEYDSKICAGSCEIDDRSVYFETCKVVTRDLLGFITRKLHCIGYAAESWDDEIFEAMKDGQPYQGYTARWDDNDPFDNGDETYDAHFVIKDTVSGDEFCAGGGCVDKETYLYYKKIVEDHTFELDKAAEGLSEKKVWAVGIDCSENDRIILKRVSGTEESVKRYLLALMLEDMENDADNWDSDEPTESDIEMEDGRLFAMGRYRDYHITYTAEVESDIVELGEDGLVKDPDDISKEDREYIQMLSERGLTLDIRKAGPDMYSYSILYNGAPCGAGTISDERLCEEALRVKVLKLCNAENVLAQLEAIAM